MLKLLNYEQFQFIKLITSKFQFIQLNEIFKIFFKLSSNEKSEKHTHVCFVQNGCLD